MSMHTEAVKAGKKGAKTAPKKSFEDGNDHVDPPAGAREDAQISRKVKVESDIATKVAGDFFHELNPYLEALRAAFPEDVKMWHCDRVYPYAKGGALMFDEPQTEDAVRLCDLKLAALAKVGIRYTYVAPEEDVKDVQRRLDSVVQPAR